MALLAVPAGAGAPPTKAGSEAIDRFLRANVGFCMKAPAVQCIDRGFGFADRDGNQRLSLAETKAAQDEVTRWTQANGRRLAPHEREKLILGLLVVQTVGPEQLFKSYDADGDGELTREEVTADLKLDQRPLPELLNDRSAINWGALSDRAGQAAPLLKKLFAL